jgi:hypothetical protein
MATKKLLFVLLVVAALAVPQLAWAAFFETPLQDNAAFELNVDNSGAGSTAITITYLNRTGTGIKTMQSISVPAGQRVTYVENIPRGTSRMFLDIAANPGGIVGVEVRQGVIVFGQTCNEDCRITVDVAPSP